MLDFQIPLAGLERASDRLEAAAKRLARAGFPGPPEDTVDVSAEAVALLDARNQFQTNLKVIDTQNQVMRSLLDMLA